MSISMATNFLWESPDRVVAYLGHLSKTYSVQNKQVQQLTIYSYPMDPHLCPVTMLKYYLAVSHQLRGMGDGPFTI